MNYMTLNTNFVNNSNGKSALLLRKTSPQQNERTYGYKMFVRNNYLGIAWLDTLSEFQAQKELKKFLFDNTRNSVFVENLLYTLED